MFFTDAQKKEMKEWTMTIICAIATYLLISIFVFSARVDGGSMNPTFKHGDFLFASRNYFTSEYQTGDIVVFYVPSMEKALIKRVIGKPGDTVKIEAGKVYLNGEELNEPYINNEPLETLEIIVKEGTYFLMGDNRQDSLDSRFAEVGLVSKENIMGKVIIEVFPKPQIIK